MREIESNVSCLVAGRSYSRVRLSLDNRSHQTFADEASFRRFAAEFAGRLRPGDVVALSGPLGSGKTTFVRAVVAALHGSDRTSSPTFTFWHRYAGEPPIDHIDLFRVSDSREIVELGLEEAFDDARSIVLVEWWRNAAVLAGSHRYEIDICGSGDEPRIVTVSQLQ